MDSCQFLCLSCPDEGPDVKAVRTHVRRIGMLRCGNLDVVISLLAIARRLWVVSSRKSYSLASVYMIIIIIIIIITTMIIYVYMIHATCTYHVQACMQIC